MTSGPSASNRMIDVSAQMIPEVYTLDYLVRIAMNNLLVPCLGLPPDYGLPPCTSLFNPSAFHVCVCPREKEEFRRYYVGLE